MVESILLWAIWRLVKLFSSLLKWRCLHIITCGLSAFGMVVAVPKPWKKLCFLSPNKVFLGCIFSWCFGDLWCFFCFRNFQIWLIQAGSSNWFTPWFDLLKPPLPHFLGWIASHWRNNKDMLNWSFEKEGKVEDLVLRCTCYISIFIYIYFHLKHTAYM